MLSKQIAPFFSDVDGETRFTCVCEINPARSIKALLYSHFVWGTM